MTDAARKWHNQYGHVFEEDIGPTGTMARHIRNLLVENEKFQHALRFYNPFVDGLVSSCAVCGKNPVPFDYGISDELWQKVVSKELSPYMICLECFENMSDGIPKDDWLILYYTGKAGTVAFIPINNLLEAEDK